MESALLTVAPEEIPDVLIIGEAHPGDPRPHLRKIRNEKIRKAVELLLLRAFAGRRLIYRAFDEEALARRWEQIIPLVEKIVQHAAGEGKKVIIHMEALPGGYRKGVVEALATGGIEHMTAAAHALIRMGDCILRNHVIVRGLKDPKLEEKYGKSLIRIVRRRDELAGEIPVQALVDPRLARKRIKELEKLAKELKKICKKWEEALRREAVRGISEHPEDVHILVVGEAHREGLEKEIRRRFPGRRVKSRALVSPGELHTL